MLTLIANLKGGSGKSTVAFNLAIWLLKRGAPVVAYDLDPQCTLTDVARVRREENHTPELVVHTVRAVFSEQLRAHQGEVILDVGAANIAAMQEAIRVADRILIPVPPSQPDVWATQRFMHMVKGNSATENHAEVLSFVNRADTHTAVRESDEAEEALQMVNGITVVSRRLKNRTIFRRSMSEGLAVFELSPSSKASIEFHELALELYPELAEKSVQ